MKEEAKIDDDDGKGRIGPEIVGFKCHKKYSYGEIELDQNGLSVRTKKIFTKKILHIKLKTMDEKINQILIIRW